MQVYDIHTHTDTHTRTQTHTHTHTHTDTHTHARARSCHVMDAPRTSWTSTFGQRPPTAGTVRT